MAFLVPFKLPFSLDFGVLLCYLVDASLNVIKILKWWSGAPDFVPDFFQIKSLILKPFFFFCFFKVGIWHCVVGDLHTW